MNDQISQMAKWAAENHADGLPIVILPSGNVTFSESARKLFTLIAPARRMFVRSGVVTILKPMDEDSPVLDSLHADEARSYFEKYGKLMAWRSGKGNQLVLAPTNCSTESAKGLLASEEAKTILPKVRGLVNCPILRIENGQLSVAGEGYDEVTRLYIIGGETPATVTLPEAVKSLLSLLEEFDFQTEGDKARALASFISPALRMGSFLKGRLPADVAEADKSQAGKTYRQDLTAAIYNAKLSLVTQKEGGVGSVDESFNTALVNGLPFIQLDNFRGRFSSTHLEAFMTADGSFSCRVPYRGEVSVSPKNYFIFLSSNGVDTTKDLANRSNIIRIRKKAAGYEFKKYEEGDLLQHLRQRQGYYLGCVFSVISEWHSQGQPRTNETRHDFREWVQVVDWIIQNIFKMVPVMDGHQQAQERVSNPALVWLRAVALAANEANELNQELTATEIYELCQAETIDVPGMQNDAGEETGKKIIGTLMGRLFRDGDKIEVEGFTVTRQEKMVARKNTAGGGRFMSKTYTITRG